MERSDNTPSEPVDAINAASQWSKVSKKRVKRRTHLYWLGGGLVALLLVVSMSSDHTTMTRSEKTSGLNRTHYDAALNANLAHLRALDHQKPTVTTALDNAEPPLTIRTDGKAYLARQNAPTSMYSSSIRPVGRATSTHPVQQATFAGQGANAQFGNTHTTTTTVHAIKIPHPGFTVASGEFLQAVLETAINSNLPGLVRAVVSKPVYATSGDRTLIPAGSRLIGQYASAIVQGQNRVLVIWNRVLLPDGIAIQLNSPGTDALGRAGQGVDRVDTHFLARFGESALLSLLGAGAATAGVSPGDQTNSAAQYRMAIAQSFQQSAQQSLQGSLPIKPTLYVFQGAMINVFVAHDLSFYRVLKRVIELPHPMPSFVK